MSTATATMPQVFLAVRQVHPDLLPLLQRLKLPIVCLTRESSAFLQEHALAHLSVTRPTASTFVSPQDVLIACLLPDRTDVFLHSLIRSCCEKKSYVLTRFEDYASFSLAQDGGSDDDEIKQRLIARGFEYCAGFDHLLAKRVVGQTNKVTSSGDESLPASFQFEEDESCALINAVRKAVGAPIVEHSVQYVAGPSKDADIGPSREAKSVATRVAPDEDVEDERWDFAFVFFLDGESVLPGAEHEIVGPCFCFESARGRDVDVTKAKAAALASANRVVDACAFSDSPYKGALVLRVSRRGRVVHAVFDDEAFLEPIFANVIALDKLLEACATKSLGFAPSLQLKEPVVHRRKVRIAALGSTPGGSSLQPILDELARSGSALGENCEVVIALSDKEGAGVLKRAEKAGIPQLWLSAKSKTRVEFDARVTDELERRGVDVIVLVGYMRIVSNEFCAAWEGRMLNVHPSLLPEFAGGMDLQVHTAVLQAKKTISGCTVHLVTEIVDGGPIVLQKSCEVFPETDTPEALKARVQALEGPCLIESILNFALKQGFFADKLTYEIAGVSTARGDELVERIKNFCKATRRPGCDPDLGGFGACFNLHSLGYEDPIMVSGTDGVGTKLVLAQELQDESTVGIDLVAMSVNDLIVQGAEPMFFLDYFACGKLSLDQGARVIAGIARGCEISGCALIGGETAEMPGMYPEGTYDLAGFAFGVVERKKLLPKKVSDGDILVALRSSGVHSNGYSLVRRILKGMDLSQPPPFASTSATMKDIVMAPTRIYYKTLKRVLGLDLIEALSHITGSGMPGNLPRVYNENELFAEINLSSWTPPAIFQFLSQRGPVTLDEMLSTFNCGVGMVLFVKPENLARVMELLPMEEEAFVLGRMCRKASPTDNSVKFIGQSPLGAAASAATTQAVTYSQAGVDIHAGDSFVDRIKPMCKQTRRPGCLALELGGFGSLFDLKEMAKKYKQPVVVSGTDGVGTKLLLAQEQNKHNTVGIDLVAMSVNDLIVQGAEPVFFLDYLACGKLHIDRMSQVVEGIAKGCLDSECALVGGETAEMPGMYDQEEYDLAGFAVGVVERDDLLPKPSEIGNVLLGMRSSGVHSNGYSLVRKVVERAKADLSVDCPFAPGRSLGEALLEPTKIYWKALKPLLEQKLIHAMAHITGSGIEGNLPRVYNEKELFAEVDLSSWKPPAVFHWLQEHGNIDTREMLATFNCGLGMILICKEENVQRVMELLPPGECVGVVGKLKAKSVSTDPSVVFVNENVFFG